MQLKATIPNLLTIIRVLIIPFFVLICYLPVILSPNYLNAYHANFAEALIFAIAGATDWLDGKVARKWHQTTELGAFLDPVADKLLVACALVLLVRWNRTYAFLSIIIISRELCVTALREMMARKNLSEVVAVVRVGKWKTAAQITAIITLLLGQFPYTHWDLVPLGNIFLVIAVILTIVSFIHYIHAIYLALKK